MNLKVTPLDDLTQARSVRELFLAVYGEKYPVSLYYEPEQLWQAHQRGETVCQVATDEEGVVVGHCALYPSAPNPRLLEVGAGLVHPRARGAGAIGRLVGGLLDQVREKQMSDWVFGEAVCNHTVTQRTLTEVNFVETALEIDLMPASAYSKEASASGRVSTLLSFFQISDSAQDIHLPTRYRRSLEELYLGLDVQRVSLPCDSDAAPAEATTQATEYRNESAGLLRWQVQLIGRDFAEHLTRSEPVFQLMLPLGDPSIDFAVEAAASRGFFFGGLLPCWGKGDTLLLQRLTADPVWDSIVLDSERSRGLLRTIRADR